MSAEGVRQDDRPADLSGKRTEQIVLYYLNSFALSLESRIIRLFIFCIFMQAIIFLVERVETK